MVVVQAPLPKRQPDIRRISIFGATGSVGCNTVDLIRRDLKRYEIVALTARSNVAALAKMAREVGAQLAVVADPGGYVALKEALAGSGIEAAAGPDALVEAAARPADWMMAAIVGAAGLRPTLEAIRQGGIVALANKECLVCAGELVMSEVARSRTQLLPVDSEHSAVFQVLDTRRRDAIEKIILTASGGPFRTMDLESMSRVTPAEAVAHPNWRMGAKISVDSATMMNKGLELIEARHLFDLPSERIEVLVHPQSVVHSLVSYIDGSVLAQLGTPDMRTPIAYALGWPHRIAAPSARLDLARIGSLTFEPPDLARFPSLALARDALRQGGGATTVLNAANEVAVAAFLDERIRFTDICRVVETCLEHAPTHSPTTLVEVDEIDQSARERAWAAIGRRSGH
ncbi:MAG: 1-deoxy-D-xylulose-5-phosphate reductoisomerase [Dongiaceae bacterium]